MKLTKPSAPFSRINKFGDVTIDGLDANTIVLQTGHQILLPEYNEYTRNPSRLALTPGTHYLTNDRDYGTGILNLQRNWIAVYDSTSTIIDLFLFTYRPEKLQYTVNSSGKITQIVLDSRNGVISHGQFIYSNLTRDSNSDNIPDVLDQNVPGSLPNFLKPYTSIDGTPGTKTILKIVLLSNSNKIQTSNGLTIYVRGLL